MPWVGTCGNVLGGVEFREWVVWFGLVGLGSGEVPHWYWPCVVSCHAGDIYPSER